MAVLELAEVLASPYTCWIATPGTTFPKIGEAEPFSSAWTKVGTSGSFNYSDAGVTVSHSQAMAHFISAGGVAPRKAWRTEEGMKVAFDLVDLSVAQYALVMDNAAIETVTGTEANKSFDVKRGIKIKPWAMVLRGQSTATENEAKYGQYEIYTAIQAGNPAPKLALKGGPAMLALEFEIVEFEPGKLARFRQAS